MNDPLNEILSKVVLLTPAELSLLLETTQSLQRQVAAAPALCVDSEIPEKKVDNLIVDEN